MILALCLALLFIVLFDQFYWKRRRYPPGPLPLPLFGNTLALIQGRPGGYDVFQRWIREFGPVFTIWLGKHPIVIVTDLALMKRTFMSGGGVGKNEFLGRGFIDEIDKHVTGFSFK